MYKRIKDETHLITKYKLKAGDKHYFNVFLWENQAAFDKNTLDNIPKKSLGCVNMAPSIIEFDKGNEREIIRPKLGEIHFISGKWTTEIVAHELTHALMQRLRMIEPKSNDVIEQNGDSEETIAYEFGRWFDQIYRKLWEDDTDRKKAG